LTDD
jgi:hypothetical protein